MKKIIKLICIISIFLFVSLFNFVKISAIEIPVSAKKGTVIKFKDGKLNLITGEINGNQTMNYDIKDNDIITYADDTKVLNIYSRYDTKKSISGYLLKFLYDEWDFNFKKSNLYLFKSEYDNLTIFENTSIDGLLIYDLETKNHDNENEIIVRYSHMDKKFNSLYNVKYNHINKKVIKVNGGLRTLIKTENTQGVAYEPEN